MPYKVEKKGNKYFVINMASGKVKGTHMTKEKAQAQMKLMQGIEHGWKPTGKK